MTTAWAARSPSASDDKARISGATANDLDDLQVKLRLQKELKAYEAKLRKQQQAMGLSQERWDEMTENHPSPNPGDISYDQFLAAAKQFNLGVKKDDKELRAMWEKMQAHHAAKEDINPRVRSSKEKKVKSTRHTSDSWHDDL
jgi:hypothetical protein